MAREAEVGELGAVRAVREGLDQHVFGLEIAVDDFRMARIFAVEVAERPRDLQQDRMDEFWRACMHELAAAFAIIKGVRLVLHALPAFSATWQLRKPEALEHVSEAA